MRTSFHRFLFVFVLSSPGPALHAAGTEANFQLTQTVGKLSEQALGIELLVSSTHKLLRADGSWAAKRWEAAQRPFRRRATRASSSTKSLAQYAGKGGPLDPSDLPKPLWTYTKTKPTPTVHNYFSVAEFLSAGPVGLRRLKNMLLMLERDLQAVTLAMPDAATILSRQVSVPSYLRLPRIKIRGPGFALYSEEFRRARVNVNALAAIDHLINTAFRPGPERASWQRLTSYANAEFFLHDSGHVGAQNGAIVRVSSQMALTTRKRSKLLKRYAPSVVKLDRSLSDIEEDLEAETFRQAVPLTGERHPEAMATALYNGWLKRGVRTDADAIMFARDIVIGEMNGPHLAAAEMLAAFLDTVPEPRRRLLEEALEYFRQFRNSRRYDDTWVLRLGKQANPHPARGRRLSKSA